VFLVGDAAHVHSPAAAQGMNTGIQDAANLGWKLGMVMRGSPESLLDTYEEERRPVARQVVRLTGLAFALEVSEFAPLRWGRRRMARPIARLLLPRPRLLSGVARVVSGLDTRYRKGALDPDRVSCRRYGAGRRLPDFPIDDHDFPRLHHVIDPRGFTLVKAGGVDRTESEQLSRHHGELVSTHELGAGAARHMRSVSWVLVRPDGYIATAGTAATLDEATRFLDRWVGHPAAVPKPLRSGG
jgi:hypothetical protein